MEPAANEKIVHLNDDKIRQLIGKNGTNVRLIEKVCEVKVIIPHHQHVVSLEQNEDMVTDVILRSISTEKSFNNYEWAKNVYRHVRSATRGGFVKKMSLKEYQSISQRKDKGGDILDENSFKILESWHGVEVVYYNLDELVYVCVLERMGTQHTVWELSN
jgi:phosphate starvation-inducible protein PhoH